MKEPMKVVATWMESLNKEGGSYIHAMREDGRVFYWNPRTKSWAQESWMPNVAVPGCYAP